MSKYFKKRIIKEEERKELLVGIYEFILFSAFMLSILWVGSLL